MPMERKTLTCILAVTQERIIAAMMNSLELNNPPVKEHREVNCHAVALHCITL